MAGTVRVLLFATAREAVGRRELRVAVDGPGVSAAELIAELSRQYPRLRGVARGCRIVVNGRFVNEPRVLLRADDELALHPPYSGG